MIRVENVRMRGKLALVLALPLLALLLLSWRLISQEWRAQDRLATLAHAGEVSTAITGLVHELQRERGRSTVHLGLPRNAEDPDLAKQRLEVERAWAALGELDPALLADRRARLEQLRSSVDLRAATPPRAIEGYSALVRELLGRIEDLVAQAEDPAIARMLDSYRLLALAKEAAGQERAEGSRAERTAERMPALGTTQQVLLDQFLTMAPEEVGRVWRQAAQSDCARRLEAARAGLRTGLRAGLNSSPKNGAAGVLPAPAPAGPNDWFDIASCHIDLLRDTELRYASHLKAVIAERLAAGRQRLLAILGLTLLPVLPSLLLIGLVGRNVAGASQRLLHAMRGIAGGNFNVVLPPQSRDELGQISAGLDELRGQLARFVTEQQQLLRREQDNARDLERRSQEITLFARRVATGDLRGRLGESGDTLGQLSGGLNHMAEGLANLAERVRGSSAALASTVSQMQGAIGAQSSGASEQAASVTETMTTLEEIRATSAQTLDKAQRLGEVAEKARAEGERGRHAVEESIAGIGAVSTKVDVIAHTILSLNEWTQRIGEITGAVNDIARQLRLLSLNAAIEATKAGEAGLGFAVVAGEVKQLAEQSQNATKQVQRILEEIRHATDRAVMATEDGSKGVVHGLTLVERAGTVIRNLEEVVRETSLASRQIVAAVRQEAAGIEQIAIAVGDINTVTTQFIAATEETRAAAANLGHLAGRLDAAAGAYRV